MQPKPTVTFPFPYRWLNEDREFCGDNFRRQISTFLGEDDVQTLKSLTAYRVNILYYYKQPIEVALSKTTIQKYLKPLFPIAKCIDVSNQFTQRESKTMLPLLIFELYL